jgi:hypothetical protein
MELNKYLKERLIFLMKRESSPMQPMQLKDFKRSLVRLKLKSDKKSHLEIDWDFIKFT